MASLLFFDDLSNQKINQALVGDLPFELNGTTPEPNIHVMIERSISNMDGVDRVMVQKLGSGETLGRGNGLMSGKIMFGGNIVRRTDRSHWLNCSG